MKSIYLRPAFLLCTIAFFACTGQAVHEKADTIKNVSGTTSKATVLYSSGEYIDCDSIRINGVLPVVSTAKLLYATLGKPDSVTIPDTINTCVSYDKPFKYAHFKGSVFELYSNTVEMGTLNFKQSGITLTAGKLVLNGNTTLAELAKVFPKAVKAQSNLLVDTFGKVIAISVDTGKTPGDDTWLLMFKDGKLVQMDYVMPC